MTTLTTDFYWYLRTLWTRYGMHRYSGFLDWIYGQSRNSVQYLCFNKFDAQEIVPGLWLGDWASANCVEEMEKLGITHVISAIYGSFETWPKKFTYKIVPVRDYPDQDISQHLEETNDFIENALSNGKKILVHCAAGRSRSATIVIAYLMHKYGYDYDKAKAIVKAKRNIVEPNTGFEQILRAYKPRATQSCVF